jgi:hypothetical protein
MNSTQSLIMLNPLISVTLAQAQSVPPVQMVRTTIRLSA